MTLGPMPVDADYGLQRQVRATILEAVPEDKADAASVVMIAARTDVAPHRVREYLASLRSAGAICATNGRGKTRYYKATEEDNEMTKEAELTTRKKVLAILAATGCGMTIRELSRDTGQTQGRVNWAVQAERKAGTVHRQGAGGNEFPYQYRIVAIAGAVGSPTPDDPGDDDSLVVVSAGPPYDVDPTGIPDHELAAAEPTPGGASPLQIAADILDPPTLSKVGIEAAYETVIEDLCQRAEGCIAEGDVLAAGATLLRRIVDEATP